MTSTLNLPGRYHGPAFSFCYEISVDQPNDCPHIRRPGTRLAVRCVAGLSVTRSRNMAPPGSVASVAPRVTAPLPPPRGGTLVTGAFRGGGFRSTQEHDAVASRDAATLQHREARRRRRMSTRKRPPCARASRARVDKAQLAARMPPSPVSPHLTGRDRQREPFANRGSLFTLSPKSCRAPALANKAPPPCAPRAQEAGGGRSGAAASPYAIMMDASAAPASRKSHLQRTGNSLPVFQDFAVPHCGETLMVMARRR